MMSGNESLAGRVALVTGASRGIGKSIALALAAAGADVAVNYRARADDAQAVAAAIRGLGRRAVALGADVSQAAAVAKLVRAAEEALGPIGILVNNAGLALRRSLEELGEDDFDRTLAVNLKSAFLCTQAVWPGMRARRWGRIVNVSSGAARAAGIVGPHYNASKAGMEGLTRGYAARLVKDGITVNAVAPSLIESDMTAPHRAESAARVPLGRLGTGEEVASAVLMLVGNAYMTGQTVAVNGGLHFN
ncbi:MAG TPA: SDR family NAD(P)-dependent oxidoreductase [Burkholderiales bacterium]|nr:SDR family NAD(P)-dependent oxidoreductase [Burkholderiales bacterium]